MDGERDPTRYLEELGITTTRTPTGEAQLMINLGTHPLFADTDIRATFDAKSKRWQILSGNIHNDNQTYLTQSHKPQIECEDHLDNDEALSWFKCLPQSDYLTQVLKFDWATTAFGPLSSWPCNLQTIFKIMLTDQGASFIYWGKELATVCNSEGFRLLSNRFFRSDNPMGKTFAELWPELRQEIVPILSRVEHTGVANEITRVNLFPRSYGSVEETFWSGSVFPIYDDEGHLQGYFNRTREVTKEVISERRTKLLNDIAAIRQTSVDAVFEKLMGTLQRNPQDFPMAFVYAASEESGRVKLRLKASLGLPDDKDHHLVPPTMDLNQGYLGYPPFFRKAKEIASPVIIERSDPTVADSLFENFLWSGFEEPADRIAVIPLQTNSILTGFLVHGLNPRLQFDDTYQGFLNSLMAQASTIVSLAVDKQESMERAASLSKQVEDSERQIGEMARLGPVGLCSVDLDGKITWANDAYYKITSLTDSAEYQYDFAFLSAYLAEDVPIITEGWKRVSEARERIELSVRLKRKWRPPTNPDGSHPKDEHVWVLASGSPIFDPETSQVISVAGAVTDISKQKWAEGIHERNAAAAREAKQLQENFIDLVSHEMRNPLSAITQLSDSILGSRDDFDCTAKTIEDALRVIDQSIESAKTILECAAHQKRIIDDVLTLSKLNSNMFSVTPVAIDPFQVVDYVLRMFKSEFEANEITIKSIRDTSYDAHKVKYVALDPSRLTQIFINLITNAIKFTKLEKQKSITVTVGASPSRPPSLNHVAWFKSDRPLTDPTIGSEWSDNVPIFIWFEIEDTGRGLEQKEMLNLFNRFQQATAKTHVKYGGSGLGLFISRELCETQGGEIGCSSERGRGTTFAFYVTGRHASLPNEKLDMIFPMRAINEPRASNKLEERKEAEDMANKIVRRTPVVLMVEDNLVNVKILKKQLERAKCEVYIAYHGQEALECLEQSRSWRSGQTASNEGPDFDIILMDIEMPVMDGLTCIRRIRELEKRGTITKQMNIVVTTANARKEQLDGVLEAGADDILSKPFRVQDCMEKIHKFMRGA